MRYDPELDDLRAERDALRAALDEAVELLTKLANWSDPPWAAEDLVDDARAFLARLGRDQ